MHFSKWPGLNLRGVGNVLPPLNIKIQFHLQQSLKQPFVFVLMTDEIDLTNHYISLRGLHLSVFEANVSINFSPPRGKWETVCGRWNSLFMTPFEFSSTKEVTSCLSIRPLIPQVVNFFFFLCLWGALCFCTSQPFKSCWWPLITFAILR